MSDPVASTTDPLLALAEHARRDGLVILAGAGISMPPPSVLPGWTAFNDAVLGALARRAEQTTGGALPAGETMFGLRTLRDQTGALPIDFQAQLMEEECGPDYFRVLQAIDTEATNPCHEAVAALAAGGVLKAIVTTNFDRLIERALDARRVTHRVFAHPREFDALDQGLGDDHALPVIKVHGSVESPESMVDTLRQRVLGRPESLVRALEALFARHALLIAGFSGADLGYDKEYLGLRAGAARSPCVVVLTRAGKDPLPAMSDLMANCPTGRFASGALPDLLVTATSTLGSAVPAAPAVAADETALRSESLATLTARVDSWAAGLGDLSSTNILGAVIEGVSTRAAFLLLTRARRQVLNGADRTTDGYWRFQVNLGRHLLERGIAGQDLPLSETIERIERGDLDDVDLDDAFRILSRATLRGNRPDSTPLLARLLAYRGQYPMATELVKRFRHEAVEARHSLAILETFISAATVHALIGNWSGGLEWLEWAYPILQRFGDEPRRARLCARLGHFLAWAERYEEAERFLRDGVEVAERLKQGLVLAELHAAWGYLELDRRRPAEAVAHLAPACRTFRRAELTSPLLPALLDLSEAAFRADQNDLSLEALGEVEAELDRYPGLAGHYYQRVALMLVLAGKFDDAREFIAKGREEGQRTGNAWFTKASDALEERMGRQRTEREGQTSTGQ
jgi:tetratricopeptide (TPR) repeat protein